MVVQSKRAPDMTRSPEATSEPVRLVLAHWLALREEFGAIPSLRDLDLERVKSAMPFMWLLGVEHDPLRFRYRLIGEAVREGLPRFVRKGVYIDEIKIDRPSDHLQNRLAQMVWTGEIDHYEGAPIVSHVPEVHRLERVTLPFASDHRTVDRILSVTVFSWQRAWTVATLPPPTTRPRQEPAGDDRRHADASALRNTTLSSPSR